MIISKVGLLRKQIYLERISKFLDVADCDELLVLLDKYSFEELYEPENLMKLVDWTILTKMRSKVPAELEDCTELYNKGVQYIEYADYLICQIATQVGLARESLLLRNCLNTYLSDMLCGRVLLYSIRSSVTYLPVYALCFGQDGEFKIAGYKNAKVDDAIDIEALVRFVEHNFVQNSKSSALKVKEN